MIIIRELLIYVMDGIVRDIGYILSKNVVLYFIYISLFDLKYIYKLDIFINLIL